MNPQNLAHADPQTGIMSFCEISDELRADISGSWPLPTHSATNPRALNVLNSRDSGEQNVMVSGLPLQERRHEICVHQRNSQNAHSLLFSGHSRSCPHCCLWILLLGNSLQNFTFSRTHNLVLSPIDLNSCMSPQLCLQNTIYPTRPQIVRELSFRRPEY